MATVDPRSMALDERLRYCRTLPTLPAVALRLLELAEDADATLDRFAGLIAQDPALAGKLLRVANSPFYGHAREIATLPQAMQVLGLNAATTLALSFSLRRSVSARSSGGFDVERFWRRSLLTALAARTLAVELRVARPEEFLLAGVLREVGILVMDALFERAYAEVYVSSTDVVDLKRREVEAFGFEHAAAGALLLRQWRLPERIARAVEGSHEPDQGRSVGLLAGCLAVSGTLADVWLADGDADALERTGALAAEVLDLGPHRLQSVLVGMADGLPGINGLFGVRLVEPSWMAQIEASASELQLIRQLGVDAAGPKSRSGHLEHRVAALEHEVQRDALTGLFNRAYLDRVLEVEFERVAQTGLSLSVAFADVDRFKAVNDRFGHAAGDQLLMAVARWLLRGVRQSDVVARYGGEEFVILMPNTEPGTAHAVMERILASLHAQPFRTDDDQTVAIGLSVGVAAQRPEMAGFPTARALLEAADHALYRAKRAGRGRVELEPLPGNPR